MGLFGNKQAQAQSPPPSDDDGVEDIAQEFFNETFGEELRNHGRWYFEKIISENGDVFKQELRGTLDDITTEMKAHVSRKLDNALSDANEEIKQYVTSRLDEQLAEHGKLLKESQDAAMKSLNAHVEALEAQHKALDGVLQDNLAKQEAMLLETYKENMAQVNDMKEAQGLALRLISESAKAIEQQHAQLGVLLDKGISEQEDLMIKAFEDNMARVVEHYLVNALGDQYDLKAQLPTIIQQLETEKQAMVDDIKL